MTTTNDNLMILTITLNPSIDISYPLESFHLDTEEKQLLLNILNGKI